MADIRLMEFTEATSASDEDLLYLMSDPATSGDKRRIPIGTLRESLFPGLILPSGDTTGVTDRQAINASLDESDIALLATGQYYIDDSIVMSSYRQSIIGEGHGTRIDPVDDTFAAIVIGDPSVRSYDILLRDFMVDGGLYGVHVNGGSHINMSNVKLAHSGAHGLYMTAGVWDIILTGCQIWGCGGDGINAVSDADYDNGNQLCLQGTMLRTNTGAGITWAANTLSIVGGLVEGNGAYGVHLQCTANAQLRGAYIAGNHFETNVTAGVAITGVTGKTAQGISITGNMFTSTEETDAHILILGDNDSVRRIVVDMSNTFSGAPTYEVKESGALQYGAFSGDSTLYSEASGNLVPFTNVNGRVEYPYNSAIGPYWGRYAVDNSWRLVPSGSDMVFQRRESGNWVTKSTISASS